MSDRGLNTRAQRLCIWCGPVMVTVWIIAFAGLSRFVPPPSPSDNAQQIADRFADHTNTIRLGLVISLFACALLVPYCAAVAAQMRRIEGPRSVLAETQMLSGTLLCVEFLIPFAIWQGALYRVREQDPRTIQMLNDVSWMVFLFVIASGCVMAGSLGVAILLDRGERPVFPRWTGYYNVWCALIWVPAAVIPFFKTGPFAWNGLFAWWIPLSVFFTWFVVTTWMMLRAVAEDDRAGAVQRLATGSA